MRLYRCKPCFLLCRQVWMPNVDNQHKSQWVTVMPDFVLKWVVKHCELSFNPLPSLICYPNPWAGRNDKAKVGTDPTISWSRMRPNVHNWMHDRKLDLQTYIITNQSIFKLVFLYAAAKLGFLAPGVKCAPPPKVIIWVWYQQSSIQLIYCHGCDVRPTRQCYDLSLK